MIGVVPVGPRVGIAEWASAEHLLEMAMTILTAPSYKLKIKLIASCSGKCIHFTQRHINRIRACALKRR